MKTTPKGPFLGVNNRLPDFALRSPDRRKPGDYLRIADNADIDNAGSLRRRPATALIQASAGMHSLYMDSASTGYVVRDSVMLRITLPTYSETIFKVLVTNQPVSYVEFKGALFFSNGVDSGRIENNLYYPLGMATPSAPAVTNSVTPGTLLKGTYQVAVAYRNNVTGEVGGISASSNPKLLADGSLRVTLPGTSPGATHIDVYVSTVNGSIPKFYSTVAIGTAYVDITAKPTGRDSNQRFEAPLPAGSLFVFNGRLCSFKDGNVYEGSSFRPGYYLPREGRIPFPEVSNCVPTKNGIYIVADKSYWIPGPVITKVEAIIQEVLPYGGVKGTTFLIPNKSQFGWFGEKGLVVASANGEVEAVMSDNIELKSPSSGVSYVVEADGLRNVVSCGWCVNLDNLAATTYSDYDFTSMSRGYATKPDGIHSLTATGKVTSTIGLGKEDFRSETFKHLPAVYLGGLSDEPMTLRVQTPEHDYTYTARSSSDNLRMQRVDPGKGLRANWYDLTLSNTDGSDFTLASVSFASVASPRRI